MQEREFVERAFGDPGAEMHTLRARAPPEDLEPIA
jgi:hypothetical protein